MKELVLDFVSYYEDTISSMEALMAGAYVGPTLDADLTMVAEDRARLNTSLQEILARNCSLRRKDFNTLMEGVIAEFETKKRQIGGEHRRVREALKDYIREQSQLVSALRGRLADFTQDKADAAGLAASLAEFKEACEHKGRGLSAMLRDFQTRVDAFRREQEETNQELQRLVERGRRLRLEDLRQMDAARSGEERKAERELRRQHVERLLAHFKQQRSGNNRGQRPTMPGT